MDQPFPQVWSFPHLSHYARLLGLGPFAARLFSLSYSFSQILMLHEIHCWVFLGTLKGILALCYPKEFRIVCTCMLQPMLDAASSSSSSGGFRDCKNLSKLMGRFGNFCMD